ncbi:MAG: response regulator [Herpetosiphonaceae bacterium]|nr:response regulator [Herpetosiphonaceae bacterium]
MLYSIIHDVTAQQQTAAAQQARILAEQANHAKSEFLSRMSHELRTPLNAILGFAQLLEMEGLEPLQQESIDQILKGGRHLLVLINEVLDIVGIESGRLSMSPELVNLGEILEEAIALIEPIAARSFLDPLPPIQPVHKLLYVEGNLANFRLIERVLSRRPVITLLPALQRRLGLELANEHQPDLILLDVHLPDVSGEEMLRQLRANPVTCATPVVMLSADANLRRCEQLLAAGANAYLTKPLDVAQFLALVDDTINALNPDCSA